MKGLILSFLLEEHWRALIVLFSPWQLILNMNCGNNVGGGLGERAVARVLSRQVCFGYDVRVVYLQSA